MTSGASATSSAAYLRVLSASAAGQRYSIFTFRPSAQPNCCSACRNAAMLGCERGSSVSWPPGSTPMRRRRSPCCARTVSGHTTAEPAMALMKSRRLIAYPEDKQWYRQTLVPWKGSRMSALGHKQTYAVHKCMSALPPIATAKADIGTSFHHLVGARLHCRGHVEAE